MLSGCPIPEEEAKQPFIAEGDDEPPRRDGPFRTTSYAIGVGVIIATILLTYNVGYYHGSQQAGGPRLPTHGKYLSLLSTMTWPWIKKRR